MKVLIVYYSTYGHVHKMAEAIAEGVREVEGAEAVLRRVPETLPAERDLLGRDGAAAARALEGQLGVVVIDLAAEQLLRTVDQPLAAGLEQVLGVRRVEQLADGVFGPAR